MDGNTILHEWEDDANSSKKPHQKIDFQADYVSELSKKKNQTAMESAVTGEPAPESLVTWIFQDNFIPRAKLTKDGCYSIFTDYLGTPVGAYDEAGNLVWERELDINGKVMPAGKDSYGEKTFIPFRFQGQYEDEETGLYYNRFRYYDPETGQYTQQDPIGLAGGNPTLYGYVYNTLGEVDPFGLERVYRGMIETGNGPQIGDSARTLGIRVDVDIPIDGNGMVYPGTGGMSVSPRASDLPAHRRPIEFGGTGKDPVWRIDTNKLGSELKYVPDAPGHGTIQPTRSMLLEEYQEALANTQKDWRKVCH